MKKNKRLIILIIVLLAVITIAIFDKIDFQSISNSAYLEIEKEIVFSKVDNFEINPKKAKLILDDKNNKQAATGRYANITPDKTIDWRTKDNIIGSQDTIEALKMFNKITLDGKKISIPATLKDLGEEYNEFENVKYSKITNDMLNINIKNTKNNINFLVNYTASMEENQSLEDFLNLHLRNIMGKSKELPYKTEKSIPIEIEISKGGTFYMGIEIDAKDKSILGLESKDNYLLHGTADIRVDGIGIGSTFNDMYAKFGKPSYVFQSSDTQAVYRFTDTFENKYFIEFTHNKTINVKELDVDTKPNVITGIHIYFRKYN